MVFRLKAEDLYNVLFLFPGEQLLSVALPSYAVLEYCQDNENVDSIFKENTPKKEGRGIIAVLAMYMAI